jgi:hypothetical protein
MLLIALVLGGMICSSFYGYWKDFWLSLDGKQITATIIVEGLKPGSLDYEYVVNSVQYIGSGHRGVDLDNNAHVGGPTLVFVSSSHPSLSSPQLRAFSPWGASAIMALYFSIEVFVVKALVKKHRPSEKSSQPGC